MIVEYTNKKGQLKKWILQVAVISGLRRLSYRTPMRAAAMTAARIERGKYRCASCKQIFGRKSIAVDHVHPVVNPKTGFVGFDDYIKRLFCPSSGLQILCNDGKTSCHKIKSKTENKIRRTTKKKLS